VIGNVAFGLRMSGASRAERDRRVGEVLELVGLGDLRARRVAQLSGGEQQRVALARALAVEPRLLMLDEPLGALDRPWRERLLGEFRELLDRTALPAIYVTHDHDEAFALADRIVVMRSGLVVQSGTPAGVWRRPADPWIAGFLGFASAVPARLTSSGADTPWGELAVGERGRGRVQIVLRPDAVRLDPKGRLTGRVGRSTFAGDHAELEVETAGPPIRLRVPCRRAPAVGEAVVLAVDPDGVLVYPAADEPAD
jgi:thiamine transport system ATP-binding protein